MSRSGNYDIKDSSIHTLTQILHAKEKELSDVRSRYENLRDRLNDEERKKSRMLDTSTQTHETDVKDNPGSLESLNTETDFDQENLNKNEQLNLNNINPYTYKSISDNSAEITFANVANNDTNLVKNNLTDKYCDLKDVALEDIKVKIDDKGKLRKTGEDENTFSSSNRLSYQSKKKGDMTHEGTVFYQPTRRVVRRKKTSQTCDPPRFAEETETESTFNNETSLSDPSHTLYRETVCLNTTMQPLKCGDEHDFPEDSGCSFSSSNNDCEIDCHEVNRGLRSNSNPEINTCNPKSNTARTDNQTGNTNTHRNTQGLKYVVPEGELIVVKSTSTRCPQGPSSHSIILKKTDTRQGTPESMKNTSTISLTVNLTCKQAPS